MMDVPTEFDWVTAMSQWSPRHAFQQLRDTVADDVRILSAIRNGRGGTTFECRPSAIGGVIVVRTVSSGGVNDYSSVIVNLVDNVISVSKADAGTSRPTPFFTAVPAVTADGMSRLIVTINDRDTDPLAVWQVSKMALGELFFPGDSW